MSFVTGGAGRARLPVPEELGDRSPPMCRGAHWAYSIEYPSTV